MRKALWILSAPVVAGGLAWAVNAADNQGVLARSPATQSGKIFFFSRSGKASAAAKESPASASAGDDASESDDREPVTAKRYVRKRSADASQPAAGVKNFYKDLFGDSEGNIEQVSASEPTGSASVSKKPVRRTIVEECGVNDTGDGESPREVNQLPPADEPAAIVRTARPKGNVVHAEHKATDAGSKRQVQQVEHTAAPVAAKKKPAKAPVEGVRHAHVADAAEEDADVSPAPATRPTAAKPGRPSASGKPVQQVQAKVVRPAQPAQPVATSKPHAVRKADVPVPPPSDEIPTAKPVEKPVTSDTTDVPMISLKWAPPSDVNVGQECKCGLIVKNTGSLDAKDIVVEAYFPRTVRLLDADPFPTDSKDHLIWVFEELGAGEEKTIEISMIPSRRGELATNATVRFTGVASTVLNVEEPQLSLTITGSRDVMVGETNMQVITVANPGSGVAHDVVIHASIPEGLDHPRGKSVEMAIGSLGPNETREVRLPLAATAGGERIVQVEARGTNLVQKAQTAIKVAAPRLKVEVTGPGLRYINRHAQYGVTVANDGIAATDNVRVVHLIPEGFEFVKADKGGKHDATNGTVSWFIGRMEAGQSMQVSTDLKAKQTGEYQHHIQASGDNGTIAAAKMETRVEGTAAVVMEVVDLDDPVEVGAETAYEIRIRNDGSKSAQNVKLVCELPAGVELIDAEGPTEHLLDKGGLHFKSISELAAGAKIKFRLKVTGTQAGNLRMRAKLTSNAATDPLVVEELTKFYAD